MVSDLNPASLKKINGNTLKVIACIVMLIDHIGAAVFLPVLVDKLYPESYSFDQLKFYYSIIRNIGRTAFPIFCFLLTEGFIHTKSRLRYSLSLFLFGVISEPFFDLAVAIKENRYSLNFIECFRTNKDVIMTKQNVYFTLFLGLMAIWAIDSIRKYMTERLINSEFILIACTATGAVFMGIAMLIHSDYRAWGVLVVIAFYALKDKPLAACAATLMILCHLSAGEIYAVPAFILILLYNKKQGRKLGRLKYLFYAFYPVHLMLLYILRCTIFG